MEANINNVKKEVKAIEKMYEFIREIVKTDDTTLLEIYGTYCLCDIIMQNSAHELYDKWFLYNKERFESEAFNIIDRMII